MSLETIETKVKDAVTDVVAEAEKIGLKGEVQTMEAAVAKIEKAARIDVSVGEKLAMREAELLFVKLQMDIKTLTDKALTVQQNYQTMLKNLITKYNVEKTHVWDEAKAEFISLEAKLHSL